MSFTREQFEAHQRRHGFTVPTDPPVTSLAKKEPSAAQTRWQRQEERQLHKDFEAYLRLRMWPYVHSRMDKPSTIRSGFPDFSIFANGHGVCVEFKAPGGVLSKDQRECISELRAVLTPVLVTTSLADAIHFLRLHLDPLYVTDRPSRQDLGNTLLDGSRDGNGV